MTTIGGGGEAGVTQGWPRDWAGTYLLKGNPKPGGSSACGGPPKLEDFPIFRAMGGALSRRARQVAPLLSVGAGLGKRQWVRNRKPATEPGL